MTKFRSIMRRSIGDPKHMETKVKFDDSISKSNHRNTTTILVGGINLVCKPWQATQIAPNQLIELVPDCTYCKQIVCSMRHKQLTGKCKTFLSACMSARRFFCLLNYTLEALKRFSVILSYVLQLFFFFLVVFLSMAVRVE